MIRERPRTYMDIGVVMLDIRLATDDSQASAHVDYTLSYVQDRPATYVPIKAWVSSCDIMTSYLHSVCHTLAHMRELW